MGIPEIINGVGMAGTTISAGAIIVTQIIKKADFVADRWLPLISFLIGFVLALLNQIDILTAILIGGSASGIYDVAKRSVAGK